MIGVIAGLSDAGLDVTGADLVIGTSSGSTAAAQITAVSARQLYADILAAPSRPPRVAVSPGGAAAPGRPPTDTLQRTSLIIAAATDAADMRRRLGAAALKLAEEAGSSRQAEWRATVAARLPRPHWPEAAMLITAVDAHSGEPVVFDRHSGVALADAVAASTSSGPAYVIGDSAYIDGGYRRSSENADLAAGYERVLVLSPLGGRTRAPLSWGLQLEVQVEELRARGSRVEAVLPDAASLGAFGSSMMDLSRRAPAAATGYEQGLTYAEELGPFWS